MDSFLTVESSITLQDVWTRYKIMRALKGSTISDYEKRMKLIPGLLAAPVASISVQELSAIYTRLLASNGITTANYVMRIVRALLSFSKEALTTFQDQPVITLNPACFLPVESSWKKPVITESNFKLRSLEEWFMSAMSYQNAAIADWLIFLLFSGFRRNEGTGLTWQSVDLDRGTIQKDDRLIPLSDVLLNILRRRRNNSGTNRFVFALKNGSKLSDWNKSNLNIGFVSDTPFKISDLRKSYERAAVCAGVDERAVRYLLGKSCNAQISAEDARQAQQEISNELVGFIGFENVAAYLSDCLWSSSHV